jgi:hypothetical protein
MVIIKGRVEISKRQTPCQKVISNSSTLEEDASWKRNAITKLLFNDRGKGIHTSTEGLEKTEEMSIRSTIFSREIVIEEAAGKEGSTSSAGRAVSELMSGPQYAPMTTIR